LPSKATPSARLAAAARWLRARFPEAAVFALGAFLRVTMAYRFDNQWGYDAGTHWEVVEWMAAHASLPPQDQLIQAQHPPLFYTVAALLFHKGVSRAALSAFPILFGVMRLALFWAGLEWLLPTSRWARLSALGLAAVLPASVHMDGCLYPEPISATFVAAALLVLTRAFAVPPEKRWKWAALGGLFLGLALLSKVTSLIVFVALAFAAACEAWFAPSRDASSRRRSLVTTLAPWSATLGVCLALSGWYYARNVVNYHTPFLTSFELTEKDSMRQWKDVPLLDRRTLGFFTGWDTSVYEFPYFKSEGPSFEHPRFFTLAMVTTFVDYYNQSYSGLHPFTPGPLRSGKQGSPHSHVLTPRLVALGAWSAVAGTILLAASLAAAVECVRRSFRDRRWGLFFLGILPFWTVVFGLYAAVKYPIDGAGVVKGTYMQFGMLPMIAAFGLAVEWSSRQRRWVCVPLLAVLLGALWAVTAYSVYCRTGVTLLPVLASGDPG
jgi:hypothetical protein